MKINEQYINEALRIRETYIKTLRAIEQKETQINEYKEIVEGSLKNLETYINENKNEINVDNMPEDLTKKLLKLELNMNTIQDELKPYTEIMETLEKDTSKLYKNIKEKYPQLEDIEIQKQIFDKIKE